MAQNCWVTNTIVMIISLVGMTLLMMTMAIIVAMTFHLSYVLIDDDFVDDDDDGDDIPPDPCRDPGPRPTLASRGNPVRSPCLLTSSKSPLMSSGISMP